MSLRIENVTLSGATASGVEDLFDKAFPRKERMPFWLLVLLAKQRGVDFRAFFDEEVFCGFAYLIARGDITYVLYLATAEGHRSKGYGTAMLDAIKQAHPGNTVVLDIESLSEPADNHEQRVKRQAFYFRNGFHDLGIQLHDSDGKFDVLACGRDVSQEEISSVLRRFSFGAYRPKFAE